MPLASFFVLECCEVLKLLERMKSRVEFEHRLQYVAVTNAIGKCLDKKYKYLDVFKSEDEKKKEVTEEEKEDLKAYFESW